VSRSRIPRFSGDFFFWGSSLFAVGAESFVFRRKSCRLELPARILRSKLALGGGCDLARRLQKTR